MEEIKEYSLEETEVFSEEMEKHISSGQKKIVERILNLIEEIKIHPTTGTGKVERLKGKGERLKGKGERLKGKGERLIYSRRINDKHRLIYEIFEEEKKVVLAAAYGHYKDK